MNPKTVIYIILSAILLYMYYKRGGIILFAAFVVVVAGTLFAGASAREGLRLGGGGGGKGDKECAKLGFNAVKLDKDNLDRSLEKVMKNIEKVAEKEWPFEKGDIEGKRTKDKTFEENWKIIKESSVVKEVLDKGRDDPDMVAVITIYSPTSEIYNTFLDTTTTTSAKTEVIAKYNTSALDEMIKSGSTVIKLLERLKKSDDIKDGGAKVQKIMTYIMCLVKHWISIFKAMRKVTGGGKDAGDDGGGDGGDDGDDDGGGENKKKKKKKKTTKKKDDGEGDAGDE